MDPLVALDRSIEQTRPIVHAVTVQQLGAPTPCDEWDVRTLLNHLLGAMVAWTGLPTGDADFAALSADHVGDAPGPAYDAVASALLEAWRADGVVESSVAFASQDLSGGFAARMIAGDVVLHGWDTATATGQAVAWDQPLAEDVLAWQHEAVALWPAEVRSNAFASPEEPPPGADAMARLLAFVGRGA